LPECSSLSTLIVRGRADESAPLFVKGRIEEFVPLWQNAARMLVEDYYTGKLAGGARRPPAARLYQHRSFSARGLQGLLSSAKANRTLVAVAR